MADNDLLKQADAWFAGIGGPVGLFALLMQLRKGNADQEKDLRTGLADRVTALEGKVDHLEARLEEVGRERDFMRYQRDSARTQRNRAWDRVNAFEAQAGVPVSVWPPDAPDPPIGGTT